MPSDAEDKLIVDYALADERNLGISLAIYTRFRKIQDQVIKTFLVALIEAAEQHFPATASASLKKNWKGHYALKMSSQSDNCRNLIYGVKKESKGDPSVASGRIKTALDRDLKRAKRRSCRELIP
ncbi:MAG: hypothetical protein ACLP59_27050 [Bryobacteraceae bacterium]